MLLETVVIVLREVVEAALIISILLASNLLFKESQRWVTASIFGGILMSLLQAWKLGWISQQFDGRGQEFVSVVLLMTISACLLWRIADLIMLPARAIPARFYGLPLGIAVALAISREGAEIFIYGYAYTARMDSVFNVILGCAIGAGIGISIGVLCYYLLTPLLTSLNRRWSAHVLVSMLTLITAGMAVQVVMNLMQAGVIESQLPLWNTSDLIAEASIAGQLLYALIGYEATPTPSQVECYTAVVVLVLAIAAARELIGKGSVP
jgi:high-affinity iron transporter